MIWKYTSLAESHFPNKGRYFKGNPLKSVSKAIAKPFEDSAKNVKNFGNSVADIAKGVTGITAADMAKEEAKKQAALIAAEEAEIDRKRRLEQGVTDERKARIAQNQLLSGAETGIVGNNNLLG